MEDNRMVSFSLGGMAFEYDDNKNQINIKKHGISFKSAARIFFDYDRIEFYDEDHSYDEDRYNTIGDTSAGRISQKAEGALIGNIDQFIGKVNEILFVVYTERVRIEESGTKTDVTRLISARMATEFERGVHSWVPSCWQHCWQLLWGPQHRLRWFAPSCCPAMWSAASKRWMTNKRLPCSASL